jgi:hypothetical protein
MTRFATILRYFLCSCVLAGAACSAEGDADDTDPNEQGNGGEGGEANPETMDCPDPNEFIDPTAAIDDFEDQNSAVLPVSGRTGGWWTSGDETLGASIVPERSDLTGIPATPETIPGGRCSSNFAMRVTGQGFNDWGALLGMSLAYGTRPNGEEGGIPYDASGRQGIQFWARIGDTSTDQVRVAFGDANNEPDGGLCDENGGGGTECYDTFGVFLTQLDTTWRAYRVPFTGLSQRDFGYPAEGVAVDALYTIGFNFEPSAIFDFWVDDLSFY